MAQAPMHSPSFSVKRPSARGLVETDAELPRQVVGGLERALQAARQVGADGELVLAGRLQVVHVVEGRHLVHRHRRHAEVAGDEIHGLGREPALLVLRDDERAITADCFWSGGYLATSRSIFLSDSAQRLIGDSSVDLAEDDVHACR